MPLGKLQAPSFCRLIREDKMFRKSVNLSRGPLLTLLTVACHVCAHQCNDAGNMSHWIMLDTFLYTLKQRSVSKFAFTMWQQAA